MLLDYESFQDCRQVNRLWKKLCCKIMHTRIHHDPSSTRNNMADVLLEYSEAFPMIVSFCCGSSFLDYGQSLECLLCLELFGHLQELQISFGPLVFRELYRNEELALLNKIQSIEMTIYFETKSIEEFNAIRELPNLTALNLHAVYSFFGIAEEESDRIVPFTELQKLKHLSISPSTFLTNAVFNKLFPPSLNLKSIALNYRQRSSQQASRFFFRELTSR